MEDGRSDHNWLRSKLDGTIKPETTWLRRTDPHRGDSGKTGFCGFSEVLGSVPCGCLVSGWVFSRFPPTVLNADPTHPHRVSSLLPGVVSLISLAVLSFERYSTMMTPTEADVSNYCKVCLGVAMSWVYSLVWTAPPLFGWSSYGLEGPGTTCSVNWTAKTANNISYIICLFVFCLIVPFLVIVFCYGKLLCAIRQVSQRALVTSSFSRAKLNFQQMFQTAATKEGAQQS